MWVWTGPKDLGGVSDQPILEFLAFGPHDTNAPADVVTGLRDAIAARDPAAWPQLSAEAEALRVARVRDIAEQEQRDIESARAARARFLETQSWSDPWRRYEKKPPGNAAQAVPEAAKVTPEATQAKPEAPSQTYAATAASAPRVSASLLNPLGPLLAHGLLVFGVSIAVSLLLAPAMPTLANYVSLFLPVLLGFSATFRWGSPGLIVAGFFAMAGGMGSQIAFDRYLELSRGSAVTLSSIVDAPLHPEATRFVVDDVRAIRSLSGSSRQTTTRYGGAGPNQSHWVLHVMPLVPRGWTRNLPVPAWIGCTTTPGFDCLNESARGVDRTVRVRDYDLVFYQRAVANTEQRHRLNSAAGAPILEAFEDPVRAPDIFLVRSVWVPLAVYGLWAMMLIGWRVWRRVRPKPPVPT